MEQDLETLFKVIENDILLLKEKAIKENWTAEQFIEVLEVLFE